MENINAGITLMVIGMSTVFVFLTIMIFAMIITTKIIGYLNKYFPEIGVNNGTNKKNNNDAEIALAITVAMRERAKVHQ